MKPGIELIDETLGEGAPLVRHGRYDVRLRFWLHRGDAVRWDRPWGLLTNARLEDDGSTLFTALRVDREQMFAGLFYSVHGMRVGGTRRVRVAPHLAYGEKGLDGRIPPNALLTVEVTVLSECTRL
jgi:hypothetical protein